MSAFLVFIGAGLGGLMRHGLDKGIAAFMGIGFPWGILAINVVGSTAMGLIAAWFAARGDTPAEARIFMTTGLLGGFTTFSAFSIDTARLVERGEVLLAALYVAGSVTFSLLGVFLGLWAMRSILS